MAYALTLKLSFMETVVLCKALGLYVEKQTDDLEIDRDKAKAMLREVELALARGPVVESTMPPPSRQGCCLASRVPPHHHALDCKRLLRSPSVFDQRRLSDGANALEVSSRPAETIDEVRAQIEAIHDGIAALQSLDDLGAEANDQASRDEQELWKRMEALEQRLRQLEGVAT